MVSLNHDVPGKPISTLSIAVNSIIQKKRDLRTFNALKVLNPSLFVPAHIPKNPSTDKTDTMARYCSALFNVKLAKYEQINAAVVEIDKRNTVNIFVFM